MGTGTPVRQALAKPARLAYREGNRPRPTGQAPTTMQPEAIDLLTSALTGRYRLERELGRGGMAVVFLAEDLKHRRPVALKVLRPELAQSIGSARFFREIEIAAQLSHPHIVPLFDSGEAGGFLYFVMPFVEGETLRDRLVREKQLPLDLTEPATGQSHEVTR